MDKKNTVIGVLLLVAAMVSYYLSARFAPPPSSPGAPAPTAISTPGPSVAPGAADTPAASAPGLSAPTPTSFRSAPVEFVTLENDFVAARFTSAGGAIDSIELKKHAAVLGQPARYVLNALHAAPALSLADFPGLDQHTAYELVSHDATSVVYRATLPGQLEVTRRYTLLGGATGDPYQIRHETTFRNLTDQTLPLPRTAIQLGTAAPINAEDLGLHLNVGYYDGSSFTHYERAKLEGGGFLSGFGIGSKTDLPHLDQTVAFQWASVKNQYFASILTPDQPGTALRIERVKVYPAAPATDRRAYGITGIAYFDAKPLAAGAASTWGATYYAGPKEYTRLANTDRFKKDEDLVMQFGFFGWFAKLLVTIMNWVHRVLGGNDLKWGWGWAIVLTTLILKIVFVPFTLAASRSSKRMQKLMPLVTALREKHKDNPQKAQTAMMQLYKDHKVNPLGGCIPVLITIPFFIGFFSMLQSTSELRFAAFLWAPDLAAPDTIWRLPGLDLPLNIMPLLMGATMIIQMRLTPTPTADNMQATMFKFMPWIFTLFCYNFSCALALYSTINGLFTIGQQMVINRLPEPELATPTPGGAAPGGMKNVTPKRKK